MKKRLPFFNWHFKRISWIVSSIVLCKILAIRNSSWTFFFLAFFIHSLIERELMRMKNRSWGLGCATLIGSWTRIDLTLFWYSLFNAESEAVDETEAKKLEYFEKNSFFQINSSLTHLVGLDTFLSSHVFILTETEIQLRNLPEIPYYYWYRQVDNTSFDVVKKRFINWIKNIQSKNKYTSSLCSIKNYITIRTCSKMW